MVLRNGIDCSVKITKAIAEELVRQKQTFICRYLVPDGYSKHMTKEEAQIISDAGLDILSVYETVAGMALGDTNGGITNGQTALECARKVGQPRGSVIYFAVDFDVTKAEQYDVIERYLRGAQKGLGTDYEVGVYGEYSVVESMKNRDACKHFWQTYAWSAGKRHIAANVYQYRNGETMAGIKVDLNNSFGNEGFWSLRKTVKPLTSFKDVPAGHWAEPSIARAKAMGIMVGISDTEFGLGQPVTREQLASVICKLEAYLKEVIKNG